MSTVQFGYGGVPGCCVDPVSGYQMLSSYFYVSQASRQTYIETMQPWPFEEWIEKGHQRDANQCKRTLFGEGRRGVQPRLLCILCQGVSGCGIPATRTPHGEMSSWPSFVLLMKRLGKVKRTFVPDFFLFFFLFFWIYIYLFNFIKTHSV